MRLLIAVGGVSAADVALAAAARKLGLEAELAEPRLIERSARRDDVVLGRLRVCRDLNGVEPGLTELARLKARGIYVLNDRTALLAAHDRLSTAIRLTRRGVPHPRTAHADGLARPALDPPLLVGPRFRAVAGELALCRDRGAFERRLATLARRPWFARHGAVVQQVDPTRGRHLTLTVAGETIVAGGEDAPVGASGLAVRAADALGTDLAAVHLLEAEDGRLLVLGIDAVAALSEEAAERAVAALLLGERCEPALAAVD